MTNYKLYDIGKKYKAYFEDYNQYVPPRINYYLNQNFALIKKAIQDLDNQKLYIWQHYGEVEEDGKLVLPDIQLENAEKDFSDLMLLKSTVDFHKIPLNWFVEKQMLFTAYQMDVLLPMLDIEDLKEKKDMLLTNYEIYNYANTLSESFQDTNQYLPALINFYIQKNKNILCEMAQDIEAARIDIIKTYATNQEDDSLFIPTESIDTVNNELKNLFDEVQEVAIFTIEPDILSNDINLTIGQMDSILFMVD